MLIENYRRMFTKRMYTCAHSAFSFIKYTYLSMPVSMQEHPMKLVSCYEKLFYFDRIYIPIHLGVLIFWQGGDFDRSYIIMECFHESIIIHVCH